MAGIAADSGESFATNPDGSEFKANGTEKDFYDESRNACLNIKGAAKVRKNRSIAILFDVISEVNDLLFKWSEDWYDLVDIKTRTSKRVLPKFAELQVGLSYETYQGGNQWTSEVVELATGENAWFDRGAPAFNNQAKVLDREIASTRPDRGFYENPNKMNRYRCDIRGRKFSGYWCGSNSGRYCDSMKPSQRRDEVRFNYSFEFQIPRGLSY
ncbi:hypothetical protein ACFYTE_42275, partial [Streptomyces sp. NPDC004629]